MVLLSIWLRPLLILITPPVIIWLLVRRPNLRRLAWGAWLLLAFIGCYPLFLVMIAAEDTGVMMASAADMPYAPLINRSAQEHGLDPSLIAAVISVESNFNPDAVSNAGAMGLMQLMPETAREMGVRDPFDPSQNVAGGVKYLAWLLDYYDGDTDKAIMAYHGGAGTIDAGARAVDREYLRMVKAAWTASDCGWQPIYNAAVVTQGPHGQSYAHYAIDIAAGHGATIYAPISGQAAVTIDGYDNTVLTIEDSCYVVTLLHGDWIADEYVKAGEVVGTEANHGYTMDFFGNLCNGRVGCGNHTHINVYDKRKQSNVDPRHLGLVR